MRKRLVTKIERNKKNRKRKPKGKTPLVSVPKSVSPFIHPVPTRRDVMSSAQPCALSLDHRPAQSATISVPPHKAADAWDHFDSSFFLPRILAPSQQNTRRTENKSDWDLPGSIANDFLLGLISGTAAPRPPKPRRRGSSGSHVVLSPSREKGQPWAIRHVIAKIPRTSASYNACKHVIWPYGSPGGLIAWPRRGRRREIGGIVAAGCSGANDGR